MRSFEEEDSVCVYSAGQLLGICSGHLGYGIWDTLNAAFLAYPPSFSAPELHIPSALLMGFGGENNEILKLSLYSETCNLGLLRSPETTASEAGSRFANPVSESSLFRSGDMGKKSGTSKRGK